VAVKAEDLVEKSWPLVGALAAELVEKGHLSATHVRNVLWETVLGPHNGEGLEG
jgi:hypothetical protein